jgi:hypothetical protein
MVKNYTSEVPAVRSVNHIEAQLVKHGAKNIMKTYNDSKKLSGVAFIISIDGKDTPFKLPARTDRVEVQLRSKVSRPRKGTLDRIKDQAERTAWKLLSDWVDVQMSLIELDQAEIMEVFFPYLYNHEKDQTFFEKMKISGFKLLENKA